MKPEPPYTAVIFNSVLSGEDKAGYASTSERMVELAEQQPGFLGLDSARDPASRLGITISYWETEDHARAWKSVAEHLEAQQTGRERWYEQYEAQIATVTRTYRFER